MQKKENVTGAEEIGNRKWFLYSGDMQWRAFSYEV